MECKSEQRAMRSHVTQSMIPRAESEGERERWRLAHLLRRRAKVLKKARRSKMDRFSSIFNFASFGEKYLLTFSMRFIWMEIRHFSVLFFLFVPKFSYIYTSTITFIFELLVEVNLWGVGWIKGHYRFVMD